MRVVIALLAQRVRVEVDGLQARGARPLHVVAQRVADICGAFGCDANGFERVVAEGFSEVCADDHAQLAAELPVYDALYAWCRLQERMA